MKPKSIIVLIIGFMMVILMPLAGVADDGMVPGVPFQALQAQIDDLQQQIAAPLKAIYANNYVNNLAANTEYEVLVLTLPAGKYVSTITLQAHYNTQTDITTLSCRYVPDPSHPVENLLFGGDQSGQETHAHTMATEFWGNVTLTLKCYHTPITAGSHQFNINHAAWTVIKVGELDDQSGAQ